MKFACYVIVLVLQLVNASWDRWWTYDGISGEIASQREFAVENTLETTRKSINYELVTQLRNNVAVL